MTIAVVPEVLKIRSVYQRDVGIRASQGVAALLCGLLEPSFLDESFKAFEDRVEIRPVGEDLVGEGGCEGANLM